MRTEKRLSFWTQRADNEARLQVFPRLDKRCRHSLGQNSSLRRLRVQQCSDASLDGLRLVIILSDEEDEATGRRTPGAVVCVC